MRAILITALSLSLWGCSNGRTRIQVLDRNPPAGWHGTYVLAPSAIETNRATTYAKISFIGPGRAQIEAVDRDYPNWIWSAAVSTVPGVGHAFRLRCEAIFIFQTEGRPSLAYSQTRGEAGKYFLENGEGRATIPLLLEANARLDSVVPKALRACTEANLEFNPEVLAGGEVILVEAGGLRYYSQESEAFKTMVKRLPETSGSLSQWKPGIWASPSNAYLPLPQTHKFYCLRQWKAGSRATGGLLLTAPMPSRPELPQDAAPFLLNLVERGDWVVPTIKAVRLYQMEAGAEHEREVKVAADGLEIELDEISPGARLEIEYSKGEEDRQTLVQSFSLSPDGSLKNEAARLGEREAAN